jgi:hypothetical protein
MVVAQGRHQGRRRRPVRHPKTIEARLDGVYRKPGVRSRVELVHRLEHTAP